MRRPTQAEIAAMTVNPNPRIVALMDYALGEVMTKIGHRDEYSDWLAWAASWRRGERDPQACVDASHHVTRDCNEDMIAHALGQVAWGAKEACYQTKTSGWLVIRYIADAMCAFGVAFPDRLPDGIEPARDVGGEPRPCVSKVPNLRVQGTRATCVGGMPMTRGRDV